MPRPSVVRAIPATYRDAAQRLAGKDRRKVANHTILRRAGDDIELIYHWTPIATFHANGTVTLTTGGFHTVSTVSRLDTIASAYNFRLHTVRGELILSSITDPGYQCRFTDGRVIG